MASCGGRARRARGVVRSATGPLGRGEGVAHHLGLCYEARPDAVWREPTHYDCSWGYMQSLQVLRHLSDDS